MQAPSPIGQTPSIPLPTQPVVLGDLPGLLGCCVPSATIAAGATQFSGPYTLFNAAEAGRQFPMPAAKTIRQLVFVTNGAQPAAQALTLTVRKNGVDTGIVIVIPALSAAGTFFSPIFAVAFAAGDLFSLKAVQDAGAAVSATILGWSVV